MAEVAPLQFSIEDVRLCLQNADRLRRDARFRTLGTKLALYEFALEELAKGNMILLRLQLADAIVASSTGRTTGSPSDCAAQQVFQLLSDNARFFSDETIRKAFWDHDVKLEFVEFLAKIMMIAVARFESEGANTSSLPLRYRAFGAVANVGPVRRIALGQLRTGVDHLKRLGFDSLDTICKRALFAGLDRRTGKLTSPTADRELMWDIWMVLIGLRMSIVIADRLYRKTGRFITVA